MNDGDAERGALPLNLGLALAHGLQLAPVTADLPLVAPRVAVEAARFGKQAVRVGGHGPASGAWCCMTRRPNRISGVAAAKSSSAVNSSARPAGWPLVCTGSGLPDW